MLHGGFFCVRGQIILHDAKSIKFGVARTPKHGDFNLRWGINKSLYHFGAATSKAETTIADFRFEAGI